MGQGLRTCRNSTKYDDFVVVTHSQHFRLAMPLSVECLSIDLFLSFKMTLVNKKDEPQKVLSIVVLRELRSNLILPVPP